MHSSSLFVGFGVSFKQSPIDSEGHACLLDTMELEFF